MFVGAHTYPCVCAAARVGCKACTGSEVDVFPTASAATAAVERP